MRLCLGVQVNTIRNTATWYQDKKHNDNSNFFSHENTEITAYSFSSRNWINRHKYNWYFFIAWIRYIDTKINIISFFFWIGQTEINAISFFFSESVTQFQCLQVSSLWWYQLSVSWLNLLKRVQLWTNISEVT